MVEEENKIVNYENIEYKTNNYGIREEDISLLKKGNEYRIMALGDSYLWGDGLSYNQLITTKIETKLNTYFTGKKIELINTGIGGYNTEDQYKQLKRLEPIYKPNAVIIFFFTNDVLETDSIGNSVNWKQNLKEYLRTNSKFIAYLYYLYRTKFNSLIGSPKFLLPDDYFNLDEGKPGWCKFINALSKIEDYCEEKELEIYFVFIPTLTDLDENYPYQELFNSVKQIVDNKGIPFINFRIPLQEYPPEKLWVSLENVHWNSFATSICADYITEYLVNDLKGKILF